MRLTGRISVGIGLVLWASRSLAAQAPGLPVTIAGVPRGPSIAVDLGFPNTDAGKGTAYSVGGTFGSRRFGLGVFISRVEKPDPYVSGYMAAGFNLNYKLFGGPLVPFAVNLQAGAAYANPEPVGPPGGPLYSDEYGTHDKVWHLPAGVGISWTFSRPVVSIKPWIAPRVDVTHTSFPGTVTQASFGETSTGFGLSGGLQFGFINGFTVSVAYDRVWREENLRPSTIGVGVSYTFR